jgi:hypothetical protein
VLFRSPDCVTPGTWQTWDAFNGGWWALSAGTFGPPLTTLKFYRSQHPNARIVNTLTGGGGVRIVTGFGAGSWDNFIGNADAFQIGVGPDTTIYDFEPAPAPSPATGGVIIHEFRTGGPGGDLDEYVELYNTSDSEIAVQASDASGGWALVRRGADCNAAPVVVATIPNGTFIPARGHYLLGGSQYSLSAYPAGHGTTATLDQVTAVGIGGTQNIGLFNSATTFTAATRLDAVGIDANTGTTCALLTETTPLLPPRSNNDEYAFVRKAVSPSGIPQDTNHNANDFVLVSTTPNQSVGDNPAPILGAPGPENRTSPVNRNNTIALLPLDESVSINSEPNRQRNFFVEPCAPQGNLLLRRTFQNLGSQPVTRLRWRITHITTVNSPGAGPSQAVLRVRNAPDEFIFIPGRNASSNVHGTTREEPPNQPAPRCGGWNTSLTDDEITLSAPLNPGQSVDVVFRFGIEQPGAFRVLINIEALESNLPTPPPEL